MSQKKNIVKTYKGNQEKAQKLFLQDAERMAKKGYQPVSENWQPGSYGFGDFLVALLLCFLLIGILVFIYMIIVKPAGTLTVTYRHGAQQAIEGGSEKTCPMCAEKVKEAALVCRFCGHQFAEGQ